MRHVTAIHEAGHAIIGRALGLVCGHVTIREDKDSSGHSVCADPYDIWRAWEDRGKYRDMDSVLRGRIISLMAGREAEIECLGEYLRGDGDDQRWIWYMLADLLHPDMDAVRYEARLRRATRALVRRHREKIEAVAMSLLERDTLGADEVDAIFRQQKEDCLSEVGVRRPI
jgi:ATP-dependent Zn protease